MPLLFPLLAGLIGAAIGATVLGIAIVIAGALSRRRRRRRIASEGPDAIEAWMAPIPVIVPQRAPRNGTPWHDEDPPINQ